jgi:hypothetical protein
MQEIIEMWICRPLLRDVLLWHWDANERTTNKASANTLR